MKAWSNKRVISGENLTAYEKWELGSLAEPSVSISSADEPSLDLNLPAEMEVAVAEAAPTPLEEVAEEPVSAQAIMDDSPYPTAEEIEAIHAQAHEEGYQAGLAAAKAEVDDHLLRLSRLIEQIAQTPSDLVEAISPQVVDLSIAIAEQVIRSSLVNERERVLPVVREALEAGLQLHQPGFRLYVSADDHALVEQNLGAEITASHCKLLTDPLLEAGGCRVEHHHGAMDFSLPTRWERVVSALAGASVRQGSPDNEA